MFQNGRLLLTCIVLLSPTLCQFCSVVEPPELKLEPQEPELFAEPECIQDPAPNQNWVWIRHKIE